MTAQGDLSGDRLELRVVEARGLPQVNISLTRSIQMFLIIKLPQFGLDA